VIWASLLYQEGRAQHFVTSGNAVYNRYPEALALKSGMVALGIPAELIVTETQALHTDQNMGFSLRIAERLGFERMAVASDRNQAVGGCTMLRRWGQACQSLPIDRGRVHERRMQPLPEVVVKQVPRDQWMTLEERELALAQAAGRRRRPRSVPYYIAKGFLGLFGFSGPPEPPGEEPTL
jgi:hypothetical protein